MRRIIIRYKDGDQRTQKSFLFFPMELYSVKNHREELRWLETASWIEEYIFDVYSCSYCWVKLYWED